uniref:Uncharacterized protein n=1 Tax=Rhizophora mucronata TaxID=61149 RepID=A0A2P2IRM2_RHIMU
MQLYRPIPAVILPSILLKALYLSEQVMKNIITIHSKQSTDTSTLGKNVNPKNSCSG